MGHGNSKSTYTSSDVQNIMNTMITNATTNLTNIINQTTTDITTEIINNNTSTTNVSQACGNVITMGDIDISGTNNSINFGQNCAEQVVFHACQALLNDNTAMANMATQINDKITSQLQNNSAAQESLSTLAQCQTAQQQQGGITGLLSQIANTLPGMLNSLTGGGNTDSQNITKVLNNIGVNLSNVTNNTNNITNQITNKVKTGITNTNTTSCNYQASLVNQINMGSIHIGPNANNNTINLSQSASLNTAISCILSNINVNNLATTLQNQAGATVSNSVQNTNSVQNQASTTAIATQSNQIVSDFTNMNNSQMLVCCLSICCCILCLLGIAAVAIKLKMAKSGMD